MPVFHRYTFFYALIVCLGVNWGAAASETDQFMVWGIEMEDGSAALNRFLNEEAEVFLAGVNSKPKLNRLPAEMIAQSSSGFRTAVGRLPLGGGKTLSDLAAFLMQWRRRAVPGQRHR